MTQQEHFNRSVAVLVKAYFKGDLECTECAACACGNLVAAANDLHIILNQYGIRDWQNAYQEPVAQEWQNVTWDYNRSSESFHEAGLRQIESTGYTAGQFYQIEDAFMTCDVPSSIYDSMTKDERNFIRLKNVVDVLAEIHSIDLTTKEAAKALFVKA